jgi:hypothetical protein
LQSIGEYICIIAQLCGHGMATSEVDENFALDVRRDLPLADYTARLLPLLASQSKKLIHSHKK